MRTESLPNIEQLSKEPSGKELIIPFKMACYADRSNRLDFMDVADQCTKGILVLWDTLIFDRNNVEGNIFQYDFTGNDAKLKKEYLFTMDYLSEVLTAYKKTGKEKYRNTFEEIMNYFYEYNSYYRKNNPYYDSLPIYTQTLLFIKALDVLGKIPHQNYFLGLLVKYAEWMMDDGNYCDYNNHGVMENLALLHISVLFSGYQEAELWKEHALERMKNLFKRAYYNDNTNFEHSIMYFRLNNFLYREVIDFCKYYNISGISTMENKLKKAEEAIITFAHADGSFPLIGDGEVVFSPASNRTSCLFPDIGIGIVKADAVYFSFKCKTVWQGHAHIDVLSITARYKNIDFIVDSGQYNYDKYTPLHRFMRSAAGHSGIFPIFADNLFQKEFCDSLSFQDITAFEHKEGHWFMRGGYQLRDVQVYREISLSPNVIIITDSWHCEKPTVMRQRFVLPKELIAASRFTVSQRILETETGGVNFKFEILPEENNMMTVVQFGSAAPKYNRYEETMLLDTFAENTLSGKVVAKITYKEKEDAQKAAQE